MKNNYRSEIDGLRALAVLPVIFFHAGFDIFSGGFIGVDIFFVISGYLITAIILKELTDKTFSLKNFLERRARRILPVLIFLILISSILAFIFLSRNELLSYFKSVNSTLFFYSNFYFWKTSPYFESESELEPLLHTWSLSIEEQFYIIFPIILLIFFKYFSKYVIHFFIFIFISSILVSQYLALNTGGTLNFYFTFSRAWELALGAICSYLIFYKKLTINLFKKNLLSIIGLALILFSIFYFSNSTPHPSFYSLFPTIGTALIILFADERSFIKKILSMNFFVYLGLISYSLYLWHQPLLAFGRIYFEDFSTLVKIALILVSLLLSIFSYHCIEKIFRNKNNINNRLFLKISFISIFVLFSFSQLNINFFTKNSTEVDLAKLLTKREAIYSAKIDERLFIKNRIKYENMNPKILIIGSSRVMQISNTDFDEQVLNLGVSGASIEDHIAITEMALEKFNVDKIFIGIDPWLFNKNNKQSRYKSISNEYLLSLENIQSMSKNNLILRSYNSQNEYSFYEKFLENLYDFFNLRKLNLEIKEYEINNLAKDHILRDGKRVYGNLRKQEKLKKLKAKVIKYSMLNYKFSNENFNNYKNFIKYLVKVHQKKVILIMSPYHSPSYKLSIKEIPHYLIVEKKVQALGQDMNVRVIGSYNPNKIPCNDNEFYDYMHPKESCMNKIVNLNK